jgi:chorismate mutase/prephenate dehydrogenase
MANQHNRLEALREQLDELDDDLLTLVRRRRELVEEIGRVKKSAGRGTRDYSRERVVIERARTLAEKLEVSPDLAARLMRLLIESSLTAQEQDRLAASKRGRGQRALVVGGAGQMGRWFVQFLDAQGFSVAIADPAANDETLEASDDWRHFELSGFDVVVVSAPMRASNDIMLAMAEQAPETVIFDVSSLKAPVRAGLDALAEAGVAVASMHPMFGPDTELLSERHVVICPVGSSEAASVARGLFDDTMASIVEMDIEEHDRAMSFVLGLSHAVNIAFSDALVESGERAERLHEVSSTTFANQLAVASAVMHENPSLYYEIQALNPYADDALGALEASVRRIRERVASHDEAAFDEIFRRGRALLEDRPERLEDDPE